MMMIMEENIIRQLIEHKHIYLLRKLFLIIISFTRFINIMVINVCSFLFILFRLMFRRLVSIWLSDLYVEERHILYQRRRTTQCSSV
jgi:hypothetical protein